MALGSVAYQASFCGAIVPREGFGIKINRLLCDNRCYDSIATMLATYVPQSPTTLTARTCRYRDEA